ncbi:peptidylprolyl isomerase [Pseudooceanicola sp. CBS1P-1]|uniref:Parvulin-like PPIase n=1 Tax=Pseudooceanicola albus TaxID=2692189 RepID=A0A6L7FXH3_9RHOB|nr:MULTISPECIES: peptidylprolyl isomerase [Pseudooceanicola]MBT9383222.1 peptidylprolyl isomerase [Pseudooceanicola endophyticus]MXN16455.1 peptidylprolyl isomerase [Pseudooceanicola albus]
MSTPATTRFQGKSRAGARALPLALAMMLALAPLAPQGASAQTFGPAIRVNDKVITQYEIDQRTRLLTVLGAPGDVRKMARDALIDEKLELGAADSFGFALKDDQIQAAMEQYVSRTQLSLNDFLARLSQAGIDKESFRDFVRAGATWQELVRARFQSKVDVTEQEVDAALAAQANQGSVSVAISEIFIPTGSDPQGAARLAEQISQIHSIPAFADAARKVSAGQSAAEGGKVDWMPISNLPPVLQTQIMALKPGEVTPPLQVQGALALFQLRALRENAAPKKTYSAIDFARYYIPGGHSPEAMARAAQIAQSIDTCDDLYGINKGQPEKLLDRVSLAPDKIPTDEAVALAKLDDNEISTAVTRDNGQTLELLMLCGRTPAGVPADIDRTKVMNQLKDRQLSSYADGYLAELRADARIVQ